MVSYTTKAQLRELGSRSRISIHEQAPLYIYAAKRSPTFLSHSSKDDDLVAGATRVLETHGAAVYIDKVDPELPPYTSEQTASMIKYRIEQTKKFVLLATNNSKDSNWVPWELGIADGKKGLNRIAIYPAVDGSHDTSWISWEYMGLYSRIVWDKLDGYERRWLVWDHNKKTTMTLSDWLLRD